MRARSEWSAGSKRCASWVSRRDLAQNALARGPLFFAGTPEQRLADLHAAFADPDIAILMCLRGGYGSNYLLDGLDLELIRKHPKPFFAYSDLTGMQLRLLDELGLPAFHGPMARRRFLSAKMACIFPAFKPRWPASPTFVGPAKACAS